MVSLAIVFAMLMQGLSVIALNGALTACAREAARIAALEIDPIAAQQAASAQITRCQPGAALTMNTGEQFIDVTISRRVRILGLPRTIELSSTASAMREPTW